MSTRITIQPAETADEIARCHELIAEVYYRYYGVRLTRLPSDPDASHESFPDKCLMVLDEGHLIGSGGLYLQHTYVERFGGVTPEDVNRVLREAGAWPRHSGLRLREITRVVVVDHPHKREALSALVLALHSAAALESLAAMPSAVVACAKPSMFERLFTAAGIRTRFLKPFAPYAAHRRYATPGTTMESRLVIPELDVPLSWQYAALPLTLDLATGARSAA